MQKGKLEHVDLKDVDEKEYLMRMDKDDESFEELKSSIKRDGVLVPVLLNKQGSVYSVVAGHRRCRAANAAGVRTVPAYVFEGNEGRGWNAAFAENMFRQDLSPIEEAAAITDCLSEGQYCVEELARALGRSVVWVKDRVDLVSWPDDLQLAIHAGKISVGAARNLVSITDDSHRSMLVDYAVDNGATARTTAAWLQGWRAGLPIENPGNVEPEAARPGLPPVVPYTPCIICGRKEEMVKLTFAPVCSDCTDIVAEVARSIRQQDGGRD